MAQGKPKFENAKLKSSNDKRLVLLIIWKTKKKTQNPKTPKNCPKSK